MKFLLPFDLVFFEAALGGGAGGFGGLVTGAGGFGEIPKKSAFLQSRQLSPAGNDSKKSGKNRKKIQKNYPKKKIEKKIEKKI